MKLTLLIMAAGLATRYGGLKQVDSVGPNGESIMEYSIYDAIRFGFGRIVFVIRPEMEYDFRQFFGTRFSSSLQIDYVVQDISKRTDGVNFSSDRRKPWGTAHAILMAAEIVREPFAVINADDFYGADAFGKMATYLTSLDATNEPCNQYAMVGYSLPNTLSENGPVSRGVCEIDDNSFLKGIIEYAGIMFSNGDVVYQEAQENRLFESENVIVSMNLWGFTPSVFAKLSTGFTEFLVNNGNDLSSEFYIPSIVNRFIKKGEAKVKVLRSDNQWFGLTYREDKMLVVKKIEQLINEKVYPSKLWA